MPGQKLNDEPWEHPEWYDLHDTTWTAGTQREPEHYEELILSLPPVTPDDHLLDVGAGTGKLARMIVAAYPRVGQVTLIEPNEDKLQIAQQRVSALLDKSKISAFGASLGNGSLTKLNTSASLVTVGSVLMPMMGLFDGTLNQAQAWLAECLRELAAVTARGGRLYLLETLAAPWETGEKSPRRLSYREFFEKLHSAGWADVECRYRVRDRVVFCCQGQ